MSNTETNSFDRQPTLPPQLPSNQESDLWIDSPADVRGEWADDPSDSIAEAGEWADEPPATTAEAGEWYEEPDNTPGEWANDEPPYAAVIKKAGGSALTGSGLDHRDYNADKYPRDLYGDKEGRGFAG